MRSNNLFHRVAFKDITYLKSNSPYVEIHTVSGRKFLHRTVITQLLEHLPASMMAQVHHSYYVNPSYITAIGHEFVIIGEDEVPIGRTFRQKLLNRVK